MTNIVERILVPRVRWRRYFWERWPGLRWCRPTYGIERWEAHIGTRLTRAGFRLREMGVVFIIFMLWNGDVAARAYLQHDQD